MSTQTEKKTAVQDTKVQKQLEQQNKNYLSPKDYVAYVLSGTGDKNWESFSGANMDFFNRTMVGASAATLSAASVICTFADTFDNAISGPILDRTRTRWGRVRPYLILTLPLWFISAFTPWVLPAGLSQIAYLIIYAIINYIGSIANSFYTPAYSALLYNLTPNVQERNRLIATDTYVDLLGVWLPYLFPFFVDFLPQSIGSTLPHTNLTALRPRNSFGFHAARAILITLWIRSERIFLKCIFSYERNRSSIKRFTRAVSRWAISSLMH